MQHSDALQDLRRQIDAINKQLVTLLNQRAEVALQIGKAKQDQPIYDPAREAAVLAEIAAYNPGPLSSGMLQAIFKEVIAACRTIQQPLRVAYLGPEGTYCQQAAVQYQGVGNEFIPCQTIDATFRCVEAGSADMAIVPVENSGEGSVNRTIDLLLETNLTITGEIALPIHHQLLSHAPSQEAVTEVTAHPQALAQCQAWLNTHLPLVTQTPSSSNGAAAQTAAQSKTIAAIAGVQAGVQYDLPILAQNIEDDPHNTTRFLALGTTPTKPTGKDKTSLICSAPHQPGMLQKLLSIFAEANINIIKLESRPAAHTLWHYVFYIDIEGHQHDETVARTIKKLQASSNLIKILGSHPQGTT